MWVKAFHIRRVTEDFTTFSPTFTKMVPSPVHVSKIFRSRSPTFTKMVLSPVHVSRIFRSRFTKMVLSPVHVSRIFRSRFSDGSARSWHVLGDKQMCPLQLSGVSHNCRLSVVRREANDYITRCRTVLRLLSHAMGTHYLAPISSATSTISARISSNPGALFCSSPSVL